MNLSSTSSLSDRLHIKNNLWCFPAYIIFVGSLPYLLLLVVVDNTFHMATPFLVFMFFLLVGCRSKMKLPSVNFKRISVDENSFFRTILFVFIIELCAAGNLPLPSLFFGPYVDYTDYGIPLLHSIFNSLCFSFIILFYTVPKLLNLQIKRPTYSKVMMIFIIVFSTMQRMPFAFILVALVLPFILQSIIKVKRLLSSLVIPYIRSNSLIFLFLSGFLFFSFFIVGSVRSDLSEHSFKSFGDFSYSSAFSSANPFFQVPIQYFFTPILNAYINIDQLNSSFLNTIPYVSPYLFQISNMSSILNIDTPPVYLVNPIFNATHSPSLLFNSSIFGFIVFCLYSLALGISFSKQSLLSTNTLASNCRFSAFNSQNLSVALILTSAYTLGFFIPWYGYPITIISIIIASITRIAQ